MIFSNKLNNKGNVQYYSIGKSVSRIWIKWRRGWMSLLGTWTYGAPFTFQKCIWTLVGLGRLAYKCREAHSTTLPPSIMRWSFQLLVTLFASNLEFFYIMYFTKVRGIEEQTGSDKWLLRFRRRTETEIWRPRIRIWYHCIVQRIEASVPSTPCVHAP